MLDSESKILILGLYVIDNIIKKNQVFTNSLEPINKEFSLGGPPTFIGFAGNLIASLFSEVKKPILYSYVCPEVEQLLESTIAEINLTGHFIQYSICPNFRLDYTLEDQERKITLFNPLENFDIKLFPWKSCESSITLINSVHQEFNDPKIFSFLRKQGFYIILDPQGFFRKTSANGEVSYTNWYNKEILSQIDCLKLSENEALLLNIGKSLFEIIENLLTSYKMKYVIITEGKNGALLGFRDSNESKCLLFSVPAYAVESIMDETGAGDVFLYTFVVFLQVLADELEAIAFATSIASLLIENRFDESKFTLENITTRQESVRSLIKIQSNESKRFLSA